ncbi:MAG: DNA-directed DNA polymerase [Chrysothrix sp. TS-e1954]|nr:MAG: DNA-directed DNA polymerase [Chrysothrix sp. TS-e1954]
MSRKRKYEESKADIESATKQPKRARSYTAEDAEFAKLFDDLASDNRETRGSAIVSIVVLAKENPNSDDASASHDTSAFSATRQSKIVVRLVRGLCSNRKSARLGFSAALTKVLWSISETISSQRGKAQLVKETGQVIEENTKTPDNPTKQEKRDYPIGKLAGLGSLLTSGAPFLGPEELEELINLLNDMNEIVQHSPTLQEQHGQILLESLHTISARQHDPCHALCIIQNTCSHGRARTREGVALWLEMNSLLPNVKCPKNTWNHRDPLSKQEVATVAKLFKGEVASSDETTEQPTPAKTGVRQTNLHYAWEIILRALTARVETRYQEYTERRSAGLFSKFWTEAVENGYFAESASPDRKALGFQLMSKVVSSYPGWMIEASFSRNVLRCVVNQSAQSKRLLHGDAKDLLKKMLERAKNHESTIEPILNSLLSASDGEPLFDKLTNTQTIQHIISTVSWQATQKIIDVYHPLLERSRLALNNTKVITDQLLAVIRSQRMHHEDSAQAQFHWAEEILREFARRAFEPIQEEAERGAFKPEELPIARQVQEVYRSKLMSGVAALLEASDAHRAQYIPATLVNHIHGVWGNRIETISQADSDVQRTINQAYDTLGTLQDAEQIPIVQSCSLLLAITLLQVYSGETEAVAILHDLQDVYSKINDTGPEQQEASDVILEVILGFASKSSALFRRLSELIFPAFAPNLTLLSLQSVINILRQNESLAGQSGLFDQDNGAVELEDQGQDDDDDDTETAKDGQLTSEHESDTSSHGSDDAESSQSEDDEEESADLIALDQALSTVLKTTKPTVNGKTPTADTDADEASTSSDSSMDDDQMLALDPHLAEVLKQHAAKKEDNKTNDRKRAQKDAKQNMVNFKNRVLDLLLLYVKTQYDNALCFQLILPLLNLMGRTNEKQLAEKAGNVLKVFFETAKKHKLPDVTALPIDKSGPEEDASPIPAEHESVHAILSTVHEEALSFPSKAHTAACSRSSIFLARCIVTNDSSSIRSINDQYCETMGKALGMLQKTKRALPMSFWADWYEWSHVYKA